MKINVTSLYDGRMVKVAGEISEEDLDQIAEFAVMENKKKTAAVEVCFWNFYEYVEKPLVFVKMPKLTDEQIVSIIRQFDEWYRDTDQDTIEWAKEFQVLVRMLISSQGNYLLSNPRYLDLTENEWSIIRDIIFE